jgi:hypothetical protein
MDFRFKFNELFTVYQIAAYIFVIFNETAHFALSLEG